MNSDLEHEIDNSPDRDHIGEKPAFINTTKGYTYDGQSPDEILDSSPDMEVLSPGTVDDVASLDDKSSIAEATSGSPSPVKAIK